MFFIGSKLPDLSPGIFNAELFFHPFHEHAELAILIWLQDVMGDLFTHRSAAVLKASRSRSVLGAALERGGHELVAGVAAAGLRHSRAPDDGAGVKLRPIHPQNLFSSSFKEICRKREKIIRKG